MPFSSPILFVFIVAFALGLGPVQKSYSEETPPKYRICAAQHLGFAGRWTKKGWETPELTHDSLQRLLAWPWRIRSIVGGPLWGEYPSRCETPVRRALTFFHVKGKRLSAADRFQLLCALIKEIKRRVPTWRANGPLPIANNSYIFIGGAGFLLIFRNDGEVFIDYADYADFLLERDRLRWTPNYSEFASLEAYLAKREKAFLEKHKVRVSQ